MKFLHSLKTALTFLSILLAQSAVMNASDKDQNPFKCPESHCEEMQGSNCPEHGPSNEQLKRQLRLEMIFERIKRNMEKNSNSHDPLCANRSIHGEVKYEVQQY